MRILVTGGAGYIGSHTALALMEAGHDIVIADSFVNSSPRVIDRLRMLACKPFAAERVELTDAAQTRALFDKYEFDAVIHFAGLKAVGESVKKPVEYYAVNVGAALRVLEAMALHNVKKIVFSSSATVYGAPDKVPVSEDAALHAVNPYGRTKLMIEDILRDAAQADERLGVCILRYFNPLGAHPSGLIGEDPRGIPNNLAPYICRVATGRLSVLNIYGNDYETTDGTGVRDYIHVLDLAAGHVAALEKLNEAPGVFTYNLGTGKGCSVFDVLRAYEKAVGNNIPYVIAPRRAGDIAECWADPAKAGRELGWHARLGIDDMCADSWRWAKANPEGYGGE